MLNVFAPSSLTIVGGLCPYSTTTGKLVKQTRKGFPALGHGAELTDRRVCKMAKPYARTETDDKEAAKWVEDAVPIVRDRNRLLRAITEKREPVYVETAGSNRKMYQDAARISKVSLETVYAVTLKEGALPLSGSEFILWQGDLFDAATANHADAFGGEVFDASEDLPTVPQWWGINKDGPRSREWGEMERKICASFLDCQTAEQTRLSGFFLWKVDVAAVVADLLKRGDIEHAKSLAGVETFCVWVVLVSRAKIWVLPFNYETGRRVADKIQTMIWAALRFTQQTFIGRRGIYLPRPTRKMLRLPTDRHVPAINRLVLRRAKSQVKQSEAAQGVADRWGDDERFSDAQWFVRGHWRKLAAPRKSDGKKQTWVRPYIKGNPEGELLAPRENLYHVKR